MITDWKTAHTKKFVSLVPPAPTRLFHEKTSNDFPQAFPTATVGTPSACSDIGTARRRSLWRTGWSAKRGEPELLIASQNSSNVPATPVILAIHDARYWSMRGIA